MKYDNEKNFSESKRSISDDKIERIKSMSADHDRPEIARELKLNKSTVWKYQKLYKLV